MERKTPSGFSAVPVLYGLLILVFLYLHFSQFEDFSRQMKNVSYRGTFTTGRGIKASRISRLTLRSNGLEIFFSDWKPLVMVTEDGIERRLPLEGINREGNALTLDFKYDTTLRILDDPASNNSAVEFSVPKTLPPVKELRFRAKTYAPFQLVRDEEGRRMLTDGTSTFFLNMEQDFRFSEKEKTLRVSMQDRTSSVLALDDEAPGLGRTIREWLAEGSSLSDGQYAVILSRYERLAYEGLKSRYDSSQGVWTDPEGNSFFDEALLVYHMSEALRLGEYAEQIPDLMRAAERHPDQLTWYSAPFTGDIVNKGVPLLRSNPEQRLQAKTLLSVQGRAETSPGKEIAALKTLLENPGETDLDAWVEENLFPLLVWLEEGIFLFHPEDPVSHTMLNLQAADLLIRAGERSSSERLIRIGRQLMAGQLAKADEQGYLPAQIAFSRERASQPEGFLGPEAFISLFPKEEAFSPRIVKIPGRGEESWIYSAAETVKAEATEGRLRIDLTYPRGQIHHLIFRGVAPFDRIMLHGIRWKSDPRFQRYSDGWVYDSVNRTLYIKIRQRASREIVDILYDAPAPPPPEVPAESDS